MRPPLLSVSLVQPQWVEWKEALESSLILIPSLRGTLLDSLGRVQDQVLLEHDPRPNRRPQQVVV